MQLLLRTFSKKVFRRKLIFLIVFIMLVSPFLDKNTEVEAETCVNYTITTCNLWEQHRFPLENVDGYALTERYLQQQGILVYGYPTDVPGNEVKNGQWRYYGWSIDGNKYSNHVFPNDADSGSINKNWIKEPWDTPTGRAKNIVKPSYLLNPAAKEFLKEHLNRMLDPYDTRNQQPIPSGRTWLERYNNINDPSEQDWTSENLIHNGVMNTFPSDYGQGNFVMWSQDSNGKWWYQTFVIPPLINLLCPDGNCVPTKEPEACTELCEDSDKKTSSVVKVVCDPEGGCTYYYDYLNISVQTLSPARLKAGYGFNLNVHTSYTNEYYGPSSWKGPTRVVAYFPRSDSFLPTEVELQPLKSVGSWENDWVLPQVWVEKFSGNMFYNKNDVNRDLDDTLIDGGNKWYTPFERKDGAYNFKIVAYNAGKNDLRDCTSQCVLISGSPFEEHVVRSVLPDNPFPTGKVGYNWEGKLSILENLVEWFYRKEDANSIQKPSHNTSEWVN